MPIWLQIVSLVISTLTAVVAVPLAILNYRKVRIELDRMSRDIGNEQKRLQLAAIEAKKAEIEITGWKRNGVSCIQLKNCGPVATARNVQLLVDGVPFPQDKLAHSKVYAIPDLNAGEMVVLEMAFRNVPTTITVNWQDDSADTSKRDVPYLSVFHE